VSIQRSPSVNMHNNNAQTKVVILSWMGCDFILKSMALTSSVPSSVSSCVSSPSSSLLNRAVGHVSLASVLRKKSP
jgi:hypothetical protein